MTKREWAVVAVYELLVAGFVVVDAILLPWPGWLPAAVVASGGSVYLAFVVRARLRRNRELAALLEERRAELEVARAELAESEEALAEARRIAAEIESGKRNF